MKNKAIIIISNELKYTIPLFVKNCENDHCSVLKTFITENDINIPNFQKLSSQELSLELGELGFTVMLYDKETTYDNLIVYLPEQISVNQYQWFEKRKAGLHNYNLSIFNNLGTNNWDPINHTTTTNPILSELFKILAIKLDLQPIKETVKNKQLKKTNNIE